MPRRKGGAAAAAASPAVVAAIAAMALVYYSTVFVFLDHWVGLGTAAGAAHAAAVSLAVAACFFAFVCAAAADPGSVPAAFAPDAEGGQGQQGLKSRYCDKCCMFKPPRSHHCKVCKRCDHHCVWINNCVGYANYKAFIICVLNATIGSLYSFVIFLCDLLQTEHDFSILYEKIVYDHGWCPVVLLKLDNRIATMLAHLSQCHNMTTIEYREAVRARWLAKKSGQKYRHQFDLGTRNNIQMEPVEQLFSAPPAPGSCFERSRSKWSRKKLLHQLLGAALEGPEQEPEPCQTGPYTLIMGPNILCWLCPTATGHLKDGTEFQITNH
ncbi:hypothetical protein ACP70R_028034 [Stipagrostis hirtigluma subsp. patula]